MTLAEAITLRTKNLMIEKNITQEELEKLSKISHKQMEKILTHRYKRIDVIILYKLSFGFNISIKDFVNDEIFVICKKNNKS